MSAFRDDYERQAHDIICIIKYGGRGGSVRTAELRDVADYLRGRPLDVQPARVNLPSPCVVKPPLPVVRLPQP